MVIRSSGPDIHMYIRSAGEQSRLTSFESGLACVAQVAGEPRQFPVKDRTFPRLIATLQHHALYGHSLLPEHIRIDAMTPLLVYILSRFESSLPPG